MSNQFLHTLVNLNLDQLLYIFTFQYQPWIYLFLFIAIFSETGLIIFPFIPGDSLLFAAGSLASIDKLNIHALTVLLITAAILGNAINYALGSCLGARVLQMKKKPWFNPLYLTRTREFYKKHGGKTLFLSRFLPIFRTFAPFLAGVSAMPIPRFYIYSTMGAIIWVCFFLYLSYFFGHFSIIKNHFSLIILSIMIISLIPFLIQWMKGKKPITNKKLN